MSCAIRWRAHCTHRTFPKLLQARTPEASRRGKRRPARHARPSSQHHSTVARSRTKTRQTLGAPNGNAKHEEAAEEAAATTEAGTPEALQAQEPAPRRPPDPNAPNHERT